MIPLPQRLLDHLGTLLGERPDLVSEKAAGLPLFLRERYKIWSAHLFGRKFLLAVEKEDWEAGSPGEYESQAEALRTHLGETLVLVLPLLPSYARNRMVRLGIPFIVPGSQVFLPMAMIDLRERFSQPKPERRKRLTPAAQCLILYHLQRQSLEHLPLRDIAEKIGYSPIMLTKVKDELETANLCNTSRRGRSITLAFKFHGRDLWDRAQPHLCSPVKKVHWLDWDQPGHPALAAGLTALSQLTDISEDRLPAYALLSKTFQTNLERGLYNGCPGPEDANLRLESWSYNPLLLGTDTRVDPLSLYLSLRDSPDERIQQQLETIIDDQSW
jgi:DNA-binding MarR family transcriptional regulator